MPFVDFADLKTRVTIEQVGEMLSLKLQPRGHQLRGPCPVCRSGGDRGGHPGLIYTVTSANHAARTLRDAVAVWQHGVVVGSLELDPEEPERYRAQKRAVSKLQTHKIVSIAAVAAYTSYGLGDPSDTRIDDLGAFLAPPSQKPG